ncbi:carbohydrate kinase family protein [Candidatus Bathyarchaeota archaeon]|nr:carbohydrate kinase family protein [Candidatus Bathyarchaeota archaeon]
MAKRIAFVGHVSMDKIENVNGVREQPGGAALYAAVAAKTLIRDVSLVAVVGRDFKYREVLKLFDLSHVKFYNMPSTRFHIRYNSRWEAEYVKFDYGAGSRLSYSMINERLIRESNLIHFSPIRAAKLSRMINLIKSSTSKAKVSVNTWIGYIAEGKRNRETLRKVASQVDFFILNDAEAKLLAQTDSISSALRILKAKTLIITLGELGAIVSSLDGFRQLVPAFVIPSSKVVDTTGAGDTWCGAFLAAYMLTENLTKAVTFASVVSGIKCSGWGMENLVNLRFKDPDDAIEYVIGLREGCVQKKISDYV